MPAGARPGTMALIVVVVPGGDGDSADRLGVGAAATRADFAVLYPTSDDGFWSLNRAQGTADVDDVSGLLDRVVAGGRFDEKRIAITGVSNGAGFAARMACAQPDRFAAVVPVAGGYRALDPCPAGARASFLAIHGSADTVVPYNGKKRPDRAGSVPRYTARWPAVTAVPRSPRTTAPRVRASRACATAIATRACASSCCAWGGPTTAGRAPGPPLPDHNPSGVSATRELLRFVAGARRP